MAHRTKLPEDWTPAEIDNTLELTLLDAVEQVASVARGAMMCEDMFVAADRPLKYLSVRLGLNAEQALLFATFFNMYYDNQISPVDIGRFLDIPPLQLLRITSNIDELVARGFIREGWDSRSKVYFVPPTTIDAVKQNMVPVKPNREKLSLKEWFDELDMIFQERMADDIYYRGMLMEVEDLITSNLELDFIQQVRALSLDKGDMVILLWCCNLLVNENKKEFRLNDFAEIFDNRVSFSKVKRQFSGGKSPLQSKGLLQNSKSENTMHRDIYELGEVVVKDMLGELNIDTSEKPSKYIISHKNITSKHMFYNPKEQTSIEQLTALMQPAKFEEVCDRLSQQGMRRGFTCLFYGGPGTGKTETVLQLARATGRDLLQVNVNEIKSMWVGESEKNIKQLFDNYRNMVRKSKTAPILFFNEADSIINKRMKNAERSVDKMENSVQNIILQEMENLEGIMIATTNLTQNMDKAFERRFLYKVEFAKPSLSARSMIWQSMIPELTQKDAEGLALKYDFSGGQIENIARKQIVDNIITGKIFSLDSLSRHCDSEIISGGEIRRAIGF